MAYATRYQARVQARARSNSAPEPYTPHQQPDRGASSLNNFTANVPITGDDQQPDRSPIPEGKQTSVKEALPSGPHKPSVNEDLSSGPPGLPSSVKEDLSSGPPDVTISVNEAPSSGPPIDNDETKRSLRLVSYDDASSDESRHSLVRDPGPLDPLIKQEPISVDMSFASNDGSSNSSNGRSTSSTSNKDYSLERPATPVSVALKELNNEQLAYLKRRESAGIKILEPGESTSTSETDRELYRPPSPEFPHVGKGKNIDPRNWGNVEFSAQDMEDLRVQNQILLSLQRPRIKPSGPRYFDKDMFPEEEPKETSLESLYTLGTKHLGSEHQNMYPSSPSEGFYKSTTLSKQDDSSMYEDDSVEYSAGPARNSPPTPTPSTQSVDSSIPARRSYKATMEEVDDDDDDAEFHSRHVHYDTPPSISVSSAAITNRSSGKIGKRSSSPSSESSSSSSDDESDSNDSDSSTRRQRRSKDATRRKRAKSKAKTKVRDKEAKKLRAVTPLTDALNELIRDVVQGKSKRHTSHEKSKKARDPLMPCNQLAEGSHLAKILHKKKTPDLDTSPSSSDSDSSSEDSDSDTSSDSSSEASSSSDSSSSKHTKKKRSKKHPKKDKKSKRGKKHSRKSYLKPEPPAVYDGRADVRTFQIGFESPVQFGFLP